MLVHFKSKNCIVLYDEKLYSCPLMQLSSDEKLYSCPVMKNYAVVLWWNAMQLSSVEKLKKVAYKLYVQQWARGIGILSLKNLLII